MCQRTMGTRVGSSRTLGEGRTQSAHAEEAQGPRASKGADPPQPSRLEGHGRVGRGLCFAGRPCSSSRSNCSMKVGSSHVKLQRKPGEQGASAAAYTHVAASASAPVIPLPSPPGTREGRSRESH